MSNMCENISNNCEFEDYNSCLECLDCYEEYECRSENYKICSYQIEKCLIGDCNINQNSCCSICWCLIFPIFDALMICGILIGDLCLIYIYCKDNSQFNLINTYILIPIFTFFYLIFLFLFLFWKKDALLFVISGIISNTLYLITGFYNKRESIFTIVGFSYSFFFPLFLATFCRYIRPIENKKQKYSRWYTICYFVFCICSIFIYSIRINIKINISDSKEKSNNLKYFYLLFLIIGLIFVLLILRKKGYFYSIFTVSILILEVVVLILKLITIILTHLFIKSKYPLVIIPKIIIFIIDVLLNINLLKDEIKNYMNIFMKSGIKINLIWE